MENAMALVAWDWLLVIPPENYSVIVAAECYFLCSLALPFVLAVVGGWYVPPSNEPGTVIFSCSNKRS
jgi:hypothetical protein